MPPEEGSTETKPEILVDKFNDDREDGARKAENRLYQWQNGKLSTESRVQSFPA